MILFANIEGNLELAIEKGGGKIIFLDNSSCEFKIICAMVHITNSDNENFKDGAVYTQPEFKNKVLELKDSIDTIKGVENVKIKKNSARF